MIPLHVRVHVERLLRIAGDVRLGVLAHPLLEEVRLARQTDQFHEIEGVLGIVGLRVAQGPVIDRPRTGRTRT